MTSLHFAAEAGSNQITEWLISIGQNLNARDHRNRTPLDLAKEDKYCIGPIKAAKKQTADLLRKYGGKTGEELKAETTTNHNRSLGAGGVWRAKIHFIT